MIACGHSNLTAKFADVNDNVVRQRQLAWYTMVFNQVRPARRDLAMQHCKSHAAAERAYRVLGVGLPLFFSTQKLDACCAVCCRVQAPAGLINRKIMLGCFYSLRAWHG